MKINKSFLIAAIAVIVFQSVSLGADHTVWYDRPAAHWKESIPLGNGHLGVTVYGGITRERLQLSENSIYRSGPGSRTVDPLRAQHRKRQRELALAGHEEEAFNLSMAEFKKTWTGEIPEPVQIEGFFREGKKPLGKPAEETLGHLDLFFNSHNEVETDYKRQLDLNTAVATTSYKVGETLFKREAFCSYPDDVLVMKLSSSQKGQITFNALMSRPIDVMAGRNLSGWVGVMVDQGAPRYVQPIAYKVHKDGIVTFSGQAEDDGTRFSAGLKIVADGGKVYIKDSRIYVKNANEAMLVFSCATDYYNKDDWQDAVVKKIKRASQKSYSSLLKTHLADYQEIFKRVEISFGTSRAKELPTDVRLNVINKEIQVNPWDRDPDIFALHFQFGRYMLISSSRKGYFPPGIFYWCPDLLAEWYGGHHEDINEQMNYWPADLCNMSELIEPLFDTLDSYMEAGKKSAKYNYGSRGMMICGFSPFGLWSPENSWPAGTGWFAQHYWDHYQFTLDKDFLKNRAYPFIKETALFYLDYLVKDPKNGYLVTYPDWSPENQFIRENGEVGAYTVGATMTLSVIREVFANFIQASKILDVDAELRNEIEKTIPQIAPYKIGKHGQLQEWLQDFDEKMPGHRHVSHMYPVYPGNQISPLTTPELAKAAKTSIDRRLSHTEGYGYVGWSHAWMLNICARLQDSKMAHERAKVLVSKCTYPNMLDTHGMGINNPDSAVNCIDGNFGYTAGIAEMLLQSHLSNVHLLPALPKENWPNGYIRGLKARGGYEVDIEWKGGKLTKTVIRSIQDGICTVVYEGKEIKLPVNKGKAYVLDGNLKITQ